MASQGQVTSPQGLGLRRTLITGVGMTKFERPLSKSWDYPDMGKEAVSAALKDSKLEYRNVEAVVASYCYGDPACGQRVVYELGLTGIPVFNVNNNCSSGSSALMLARSLIHSGYNCVLAVGFEKMEKGLSSRYPDKSSPVERHFDSLVTMGASPDLINPHTNKMTSETVKMFAYAARDHGKRFGTTLRQYAKIAHKNRRHGAMNPNAVFQKVLSVEDIERRMLYDPITLPMSASTADGSAAAIVCSEAFVRSRNLESQSVEVLSQHMRSDLPSSFEDFRNLCGYEMSMLAAEACFRDTGLSIRDVDVLEVHDCFAPNELFMYEALGLCKEGDGGKLVDRGQWKKNSKGGELYQLGGRWVVNPSGGLESKGHPIGATGLAQCAELCWQLRGLSGRRQVEGARVGLQHNMGLGSSAVVTLYGQYSPGGEGGRVRAKL